MRKGHKLSKLFVPLSFLVFRFLGADEGIGNMLRVEHSRTSPNSILFFATFTSLPCRLRAHLTRLSQLKERSYNPESFCHGQILGAQRLVPYRCHDAVGTSGDAVENGKINFTLLDLPSKVRRSSISASQIQPPGFRRRC